jgi:hypothetical protein
MNQESTKKSHKLRLNSESFNPKGSTAQDDMEGALNNYDKIPTPQGELNPYSLFDDKWDISSNKSSTGPEDSFNINLNSSFIQSIIKIDPSEQHVVTIPAATDDQLQDQLRILTQAIAQCVNFKFYRTSPTGCPSLANIEAIKSYHLKYDIDKSWSKLESNKPSTKTKKPMRHLRFDIVPGKFTNIDMDEDTDSIYTIATILHPSQLSNASIIYKGFVDKNGLPTSIKSPLVKDEIRKGTYTIEDNRCPIKHQKTIYLNEEGRVVESDFITKIRKFVTLKGNLVFFKCPVTSIHNEWRVKVLDNDSKAIKFSGFESTDQDSNIYYEGFYYFANGSIANGTFHFCDGDFKMIKGKWCVPGDYLLDGEFTKNGFCGTINGVAITTADKNITLGNNVVANGTHLQNHLKNIQVKNADKLDKIPVQTIWKERENNKVVPLPAKQKIIQSSLFTLAHDEQPSQEALQVSITPTAEKNVLNRKSLSKIQSNLLTLTIQQSGLIPSEKIERLGAKVLRSPQSKYNIEYIQSGNEKYSCPEGLRDIELDYFPSQTSFLISRYDNSDYTQAEVGIWKSEQIDFSYHGHVDKHGMPTSVSMPHLTRSNFYTISSDKINDAGFYSLIVGEDTYCIPCFNGRITEEGLELISNNPKLSQYIKQIGDGLIQFTADQKVMILNPGSNPYVLFNGERNQESDTLFGTLFFPNKSAFLGNVSVMYENFIMKEGVLYHKMQNRNVLKFEGNFYDTNTKRQGFIGKINDSIEVNSINTNIALPDIRLMKNPMQNGPELISFLTGDKGLTISLEDKQECAMVLKNTSFEECKKDDEPKQGMNLGNLLNSQGGNFAQYPETSRFNTPSSKSPRTEQADTVFDDWEEWIKSTEEQEATKNLSVNKI